MQVICILQFIYLFIFTPCEIGITVHLPSNLHVFWVEFDVCYDENVNVIMIK